MSRQSNRRSSVKGKQRSRDDGSDGVPSHDNDDDDSGAESGDDDQLLLASEVSVLCSLHFPVCADENPPFGSLGRRR